MKYLPAVVALILAATPALAGETWPASLPSGAVQNNATDDPAWLANVSGMKLVAIDGSTLSLAPTEGGMSLVMVSQNGAAQKSSFAFMSDKLGTIVDDADTGHITGLFRETDIGIEAQFADGRTESLFANAAGGLSLAIHNGADSICTSWYPPDHVFSAIERKAALMAYADRLGLGDKSKRASHAVPACASAIHLVKNKILPQTVQSLVIIGHPDTVGMAARKTDISVKSTSAPGPIPVVVHNSEVHLIDQPTNSSLPATPQLVQASATASSTVKPVIAKAISSSPPAQQLAQIQTATVARVPAGNGASDCLSVDSDGANLGFRNHCAYGVQFAYCLQRASDAGANCDVGTKTGTISANGFATVLFDTNIKSADVEHDFRWVACSGDTGNVIARLDRSDPPLGRCVRTGAL